MISIICMDTDGRSYHLAAPLFLSFDFPLHIAQVWTHPRCICCASSMSRRILCHPGRSRPDPLRVADCNRDPLQCANSPLTKIGSDQSWAPSTSHSGHAQAENKSADGCMPMYANVCQCMPMSIVGLWILLLGSTTFESLKKRLSVRALVALSALLPATQENNSKDMVDRV